MPLVEFDVIPFEDIKGKWKKLGSGSFGNVYKATYLGIEVAIKEVLPSDEYDVSKYFDREWRLMREARHPNVVLYIALSRAPPPDNRIFIISEFIENGNLRQYIFDKKKPLPWRLRLSFATDIVRAMSYLHARQCIHRDLKPENLLITANGRIKVTDFGFARIVAQTAEETRRLTFCGTDSYMSPEILIGDAFGLETDVYSLGIIFCELAARKLSDDDTFKRVAPYYALDPTELQLLADPETPPAFLALALACCSTDRFQRPTMVEILNRLREIEADVLQSSTDEPHIGSIKFLGTKGKKIDLRTAVHGAGPTRPANKRIPSFGMGISVGQAATTSQSTEPQYSVNDDALRPPGGTGPMRPGAQGGRGSFEDPSEDEEDEELEAILALNGVEIRDEPPQVPPNANDSEMSWRLTGWMQEYVDKIRPKGSQSQMSQQAAAPALDASTESLIARVPLLPREVTEANESTSSNTSSAMTVRQTPQTSQDDMISTMPAVTPHHQREPNANGLPSTATIETNRVNNFSTEPSGVVSEAGGESYFTAHTPSTFTPDPDPPAPEPSPALPTPEPTTIPTHPHKTTFAIPAPPVDSPNNTAPITTPKTPPPRPARALFPQQTSSPSFESSPRIHRFTLMKSGAWSPFDLLFGSALGTGSKCDLCNKRLGWKPCLECDDCGLSAHMKCGETAPMDCEVREANKVPKPSKIPLRTTSPKSKSNPSSPKAKSPKSLKSHK